MRLGFEVAEEQSGNSVRWSFMCWTTVFTQFADWSTVLKSGRIPLSSCTGLKELAYKLLSLIDT